MQTLPLASHDQADTAVSARVDEIESCSSGFVATVHAGGLELLRDDWMRLQGLSGRFVFTDPALVEAWWCVQGEATGERLHIVTLRQDGRLVALAPLAVCRRNGLRLLRWAGTDLFDYCDTLAVDDAANAALWRAVRASGGYDLALIKTVQVGTSTHRELRRIGASVHRDLTYAASLDARPGEAVPAPWRKLRASKKFRQKERRLNERGTRFEVACDGSVPEPVMTALVRQKAAWAAQQARKGLFDDPRAAEILHRLSHALALTRTLCLFWLQCEGDILAIQMACLYRNALYLYMPSYNAKWSDFSPGQILQDKIFSWSEHQSISKIDFLRGGDAYKAEIANTSSENEDFIFPGSVLGACAYPGMRVLSALRPRLRSLKRRIGSVLARARGARARTA